MQDERKTEVRRRKFWQPYRFRLGFRQLRELRTGQIERRGRPVEYDDEALINIYIEIEAHARVYKQRNLSAALRSISAQILENGRARTLNRGDRERLRKLHREGSYEANYWKNMLFLGRPHFKWREIERRIEARMSELRATGSRLFFPNGL